MKIGIMSDIHLEFGAFDKTIPEVDVLVLAGDIMTAKMAVQNKQPPVICPDQEQYVWEFFDKVSYRADNVLYVPGNHEYYNTEFHKANDMLEEFCNDWGYHYLNNKDVYIDGQHFAGGTLWTDPADPVKEFMVQNAMSDYKRTKLKIGERYRKLRVTDTAAFHRETVKFLERVINVDTIVVTHHLPTYKCVHPKYALDRLNPGYATELEPMIRGLQPKVWIHGHTHEDVDLEVGVTRMLCNPRGYHGHEIRANTYEVKVIEV